MFLSLFYIIPTSFQISVFQLENTVNIIINEMHITFIYMSRGFCGGLAVINIP